MPIFSDLLKLERDGGGRIPIETLRSLALPVPDEVLEQFCGDHGANDDFQRQYGALDLRSLRWTLEVRPASELIGATVFEAFQRWTSDVERRVAHFGDHGWKCIDVRSAVVGHWQAQRTWVRPPLFITGALIGRGPGLHLVEGHTRLGILRGLVRAGSITPETHHKAWIASVRRGQPFNSGLSLKEPDEQIGPKR